jgi:flagella basal body P-ring formation protein FlgA
MTALSAVALAACLAVNAGSDQILLRDLAPAFPGLEGPLSEQPVGFAPAPGVTRVFRMPELSRLATRLGIPAVPEGELCFSRPVAPLDRNRVLEAMRKQMPDAVIEILEYSRLPVPDGSVEFPLTGLHPMGTEGFWTGLVHYGGNHRLSVWARVKVSVSGLRVVAFEDLRPGQVIDPAKLRVETRNEFPTGGIFVTAIEQAAGKILERPVAAGTALRSQWLASPKDVLRGDTVQVEVWNGGAHLKLSAIAEAAGSVGQSIPVRNPESKRRFWAKIVGKDQVSVGMECL